MATLVHCIWIQFQGKQLCLFVFAFLLSGGQLLKERICSCRSKFFPLTVDPIKSRISHLEELILPQKERGSHHSCLLTLKGPITAAVDDINKYFFHCFSEKIRLDVSSESSRQRIHMKNQALFSSKDKSKKGLRVKKNGGTTPVCVEDSSPNRALPIT